MSASCMLEKTNMCFGNLKTYYFELVRFISVDEYLWLLKRNSYYLSHTSSDYQVQFLVYDELGAIKQTMEECLGLLTQKSYY